MRAFTPMNEEAIADILRDFIRDLKNEPYPEKLVTQYSGYIVEKYRNRLLAIVDPE